MIDPNFMMVLSFITLYGIAAMLLALIALALLLGKSKEAKRLITALRELFNKLK